MRTKLLGLLLMIVTVGVSYFSHPEMSASSWIAIPIFYIKAGFLYSVLLPGVFIIGSILYVLGRFLEEKSTSNGSHN